MLKKYLLSSVYRDAEKEAGAAPPVVEKTATQLQREAVEAANPPVVEAEAKEDGEDDDDGEDGEDGEGENDPEPEPKPEDEDKKELELTEDQKAIKKLERTVAKLQKRVGKTAAEKKEVADKLEAAEAQLAKKKEDGEVSLTEEDVKKQATEMAKAQMAMDAFDKDCNTIALELTKIDKDGVSKIIEIAKESGPMPAEMIGVLVELDNVGPVMAYLIENDDQYEEIVKLPPAKMAVKLSKISGKLEAEAAAATKKPPSKISKAAPPVETPNTSGRKVDNEPRDTDDMTTWVAKRNAQLAERNKHRLM